MIPAAVLAQLRDAWAGSLPDTATPLTPGYTDQAGGGWTAAPTAGTAFPCRLTALGDRTPEALITGAPQSRAFYWLDYPVYYPNTTTPVRLTAQSTVQIGSRVYNVQSAPDDSTDALVQRALVWRDGET